MFVTHTFNLDTTYGFWICLGQKRENEKSKET